VPHALTNRTDEPAHYVLVCTPAGLERSFARMTAEQAGEEPPEWALQPIPKVIVVGRRSMDRSMGRRGRLGNGLHSRGAMDRAIPLLV
jgi:hypothetical protein